MRSWHLPQVGLTGSSALLKLSACVGLGQPSSPTASRCVTHVSQPSSTGTAALKKTHNQTKKKINQRCCLVMHSTLLNRAAHFPRQRWGAGLPPRNGEPRLGASVGRGSDKVLNFLCAPCHGASVREGTQLSSAHPSSYIYLGEERKTCSCHILE